MIVGTEWLVEAEGCNAALLRDEAALRDLLDRIINDLGLRAIGAIWHRFPGEGGVTGLIALTESHLACHTYPEHGSATFNLYCCRTRPAWDWETNLLTTLAAASVSITKVERGTATRAEISNLKSETSNADSEISNLKSQVSNLDSNSEISNLKSQISNLKSEISNPKSKIQNPKSHWRCDLCGDIRHPGTNLSD